MITINSYLLLSIVPRPYACRPAVALIAEKATCQGILESRNLEIPSLTEVKQSDGFNWMSFSSLTITAQHTRNENMTRTRHLPRYVNLQIPYIALSKCVFH